MLWRVGRGCSHHLHHILSNCTPRLWYDATVPLELLHWRCVSSVALAVQVQMSNRASPNVTVPEVTQSPAPVQHASSPTRNVARPQNTRPLTLDSLPPELLSVIDDYFIWTASKHALLTRLQDVPRSHVVQHFMDGRKVRRLASAMIHTSRPTRVLRVLAIAHRLECVLKKSIYEGIAQDLAAARRWQLIPRLVAMCSRQIGRVSVRLLDWRIRALTETARFSMLDRVVEEFDREGLAPGRRTYHMLLTAHIRNHDLPRALGILDRMQQAGFPVDATTQAAIVSAYRVLGSDEMVRTHAFDALRSADGRTATFILNALAQMAIDTGDTQQLVSVLQLFDQNKLSVPRSLFPDGSSIVGEGAPLTSPASRLISPDVATYTILLNHTAFLGDLAAAMTVRQQMLAAGVVPDARTVAALVRVHLSANDPLAALLAIVTMCDLPDAHFLFHELGFTAIPAPRSPPRLRVKPTVEIFNALAQGILLARGLDGMLAILSFMWKCSLSPDAETIRIFLTYLGKEEQAPSRLILKTLRALLSSNGRPSVKHASIIFRAIMRHECPPHMSGWFSAAIDDTVSTPATAKAYPSLEKFVGLPRQSTRFTCQSHGKSNLDRLVHPVIQSLADRGVQPDREVTALAIKYTAVVKRDMHAAKDVFQGMLEKGMYPGEQHYNGLLKGYTSEGNLSAAEAVIEAAQMAGVRPGIVMYTILIAGYGRVGKPDQAMRILQEMIHAGVRPDVPAVDALVSTYFATGAHRYARRLLLDIWPSVAPFPEELRTAPLKTLIDVFRSLHGRSGMRAGLTKMERKALHRKLSRVVKVWHLMKHSGLGPGAESEERSDDESSGESEEGWDKTFVPRTSI